MRLPRMVIGALAAYSLLVAVPIVHAQAVTRKTPFNFHDKQFLQYATQDAMGELAIAQLAEQKGTTPDVKNVGQQMAQVTQSEVQQLRQLADQEGISLPQQMQGEARRHLSDLQQLSGQEFDRAFAQYAVQGHQDNSLHSFRDELKDGRDPSIKQFAQNHLPRLAQLNQQIAQLGNEYGIALKRGERYPNPANTGNPDYRWNERNKGQK